MSSSGIVVHSRGRGCQSPNPQEIDFLNGSFVFDLRDIFSETITSVKRDRPVFCSRTELTCKRRNICGHRTHSSNALHNTTGTEESIAFTT